MKIASLILGILGGIAGIFGAILGVFIGGVGGAIGTEGSSVVVIGGFLAIFLSIIGIIGGALAMAKPHISGIMMSIAAVGGLIAISAGYIVAFPLLITGGIISFVVSKKEGSFGWKSLLISVISSIILIAIIMSQGSSTKNKQSGNKTENQKTNTTTMQEKGKTESAKKPTAMQSFFGANSLVGVWNIVHNDMTIEDQYFIINEDGTAIYQVGSNIAWQGTYKIKGDNIMTFSSSAGGYIGSKFLITIDDNYRYLCSGEELTLFVDRWNEEYNFVRAETQLPVTERPQEKKVVPNQPEKKPMASPSNEIRAQASVPVKITSIEKIEVGTKRAEGGKIADVSDKFPTNIGDIKISIYLTNAKKDQKISMLCYLNGKQITNPIFSSVNKGGEYISQLSLPRPANGWNSGNYKIVASIDESGASKEITYMLEEKQFEQKQEESEISKEVSTTQESSKVTEVQPETKNIQEEKKENKTVPDVFSGFMKDFQQSIDSTKK